MKLIYAQEPLPPSIFLAGPSPRSEMVASWRPEALRVLDELKFNGTVLIPEPRVWATKAEFSYVGKPEFNYDGQINWEWAGIETASVVVFWVPRSEALPGFTTNVEFGLLVTSGKAVLGYPPNTDKMKYLHKLAERYHVPVLHTLRDTLATAILKAWTPNV